MRKSNNTKLMIGLLAFVCGLLAVLFWFGRAFDDEGEGNNLLQIAFCIEDHGYVTVWALVAAFVLLGVGTILTLVVPFFNKKGGKIGALIAFACLLAGGIMTLLTKQFFLSANMPATGEQWNDFGLGYGTIVSGIFAFIAALLCLLLMRQASDNVNDYDD